MTVTICQLPFLKPISRNDVIESRCFSAEEQGGLRNRRSYPVRPIAALETESWQRSADMEDKVEPPNEITTRNSRVFVVRTA